MISPKEKGIGVELFRLWKGTWRRSEIAFVGGSMAPLTEGAEGLVISHGAAAPRIGDVLLTLQGGSLVSHRAIARAGVDGSPRRWITQGDSCLIRDPETTSEADILGRVVALVGAGGTKEISGPCWAWARRWAATQTRWVSRLAIATSPGAADSGSPTGISKWALGLHRRALRAAFGAAEALEEIRRILEDWQVNAFGSPLARLLAALPPGPPPSADLLETGLRQAEALGMDLLLRRRLKDFGNPAKAAEGIPASRRKATVAFRQILWRPRLEEAVETLRRRGIATMALKGFAQSLTLFREDGLREMRDVDLLVPPEREEEARQALAALGFRDSRHLDDPDFSRHHHGAPQVDPTTGLVIELHREVVPERVLSRSLTDGFRRRAETVPFAGGSLLVPSREDRLLHLCLHLRLHRYLGCARDVLELALLAEQETPAWDWGKVERLAGEAGCASSLYVGLRLATLVFRSPVPPEFLEHLARRLPSRPFRETRIRFLARQLTGPPPELRSRWAKTMRWLCKTAAPL